MRFSKINLLAIALLVFCAGSAQAFVLGTGWNLTLESDYNGTDLLVPSDIVNVDVYLDANLPGLGFLSVNILFDDDGTLAYNEVGSSMPTYILYTGGKGATYLIPNVSPPTYWLGAQQPGKKQIQIDYLENALGSTTATGTHIWIATLVFHVAAAAGGTTPIDMTLLDNGSSIVEAYTLDVKGQTTLTNPNLVLNLPEPSAAMMAVFALGSLVALRSRFGR